MVMLTALVSMTACNQEDNPTNETPAVAQTYYYYGHYNSDEKIPLILNENNFCINISKEYDKIRERILGNVRVLAPVNDKIFDGYIVTRRDYEKLTSQDFWKEDAKSVIVTASFFTRETRSLFWVHIWL